jgi:hypothetical protein
MKKALVALSLFTAVSAANAETWSALDKSLLVAGATLHLLDWQQTRYISAHPHQYVELNPIIGTHPSQARVNQYMLATLVLFPLLANTFPEYRTAILAVWVGSRAAVVHNNYLIGIKLQW